MSSPPCPVGDNRGGDRHDPGRRLLDTGFAGDTGEADPALAAALAAYAADPAAPATPTRWRPCRGRACWCPSWRCSARSRSTSAGLAHDKTSDMAAVLLTGRRRPAGAARLHRHRGRCGAGTPRPGRCRSPPRLAAQAAVQDGAAALVVDVAGPGDLVVEGEDLQGLAAGLDASRRVGGARRLDSPGPGMIR